MVGEGQPTELAGALEHTTLEGALRERMAEDIEQKTPEELREMAVQSFIVGNSRLRHVGEGSSSAMWFAESAALSNLAATVHLRREAEAAPPSGGPEQSQV